MAQYSGPDGAARARLEEYIAGKLFDAPDTARWEFYTWLLKQAQGHQLDYSGYGSAAYQEDKKKAIDEYNRKKEKEAEWGEISL